jgi:hypothetical protein
VKGNGAWVDVRATCPYCDYATTITARDIRGQRFVLECLDCRETYVVEVACQVTHRTRALADVDPAEVLDRLAQKKNGGKPPPRPAVGARAATAAAGDNRSRSAKAGAERPPLKVRRQHGHRYGPGAAGDP